MRPLVKISTVLVAVTLIFSTLSLASSFSFATSPTYPSYATVGAYAYYSGDGGYIAFLSGVSGNISYSVTNVYANSSMRLLVNANLSLGTEVTTNVSVVTESLVDSVFAPKILPAVPPQNLTQNSIDFQGVECKFVSNSDKFTVAAGTFNATEYDATASNGTALTFWFDRASGLAIEMLEPGSYFQLVDSNIATPLAVQSSFQAYLPFILVFVTGWAAAGLLFYGIRRYYIKKSERDFGAQKIPR
jgi:hypothetical protein